MDNIPSDLPARNRHLTVEAGVALLFAILYLGLFLHMVWRYNRKDYKWRSKHTLLFSHVCIRVVSQALGVAFGILVFDNVDVFIAYLVLSAHFPLCRLHVARSDRLIWSLDLRFSRRCRGLLHPRKPVIDGMTQLTYGRRFAEV